MSILNIKDFTSYEVEESKKAVSKKNIFVTSQDYLVMLNKYKLLMTREMCIINDVNIKEVKFVTDISGCKRIDNTNESFTKLSNLDFSTPVSVDTIKFKKRFLTLLYLYFIDNIDMIISNIAVFNTSKLAKANYSYEANALKGFITILRRFSYDMSHSHGYTKSSLSLNKYVIYTRERGVKHEKFNTKVSNVVEELVLGLSNSILIGSSMNDDIALDTVMKLGIMILSLRNDFGKYVPDFKDFEGIDVKKYGVEDILSIYGSGLFQAKIKNPLYNLYLQCNPKITTDVKKINTALKNAIISLTFIDFIIGDTGIHKFVNTLITD